MRLSWGRMVRIRELGPIFLVALTVAVFSTLAGSIFDHVHKVDAEELTGAETTAVAGPGSTQRVDLPSWGVSFTAPLAPELPGLRYTTRAGDSVGLSTTDLEQMGSACLASHGGLGNLVRFPAGTFLASVHGDPTEHYIATVGDHDYSYQTPQNECSSNPQSGEVINREESGIFGALDSLAPISAP